MFANDTVKFRAVATYEAEEAAASSVFCRVRQRRQNFLKMVGVHRNRRLYSLAEKMIKPFCKPKRILL
jgi:hypothetical protein